MNNFKDQDIYQYLVFFASFNQEEHLKGQEFVHFCWEEDLSYTKQQIYNSLSCPNLRKSLWRSLPKWRNKQIPFVLYLLHQLPLLPINPPSQQLQQIWSLLNLLLESFHEATLPVTDSDLEQWLLAQYKVLTIRKHWSFLLPDKEEKIYDHCLRYPFNLNVVQQQRLELDQQTVSPSEDDESERKEDIASFQSVEKVKEKPKTKKIPSPKPSPKPLPEMDFMEMELDRAPEEQARGITIWPRGNVCNTYFGIRQQQIMQTFISQHSRIPQQQEQTFFIASDSKDLMTLEILQGESLLAEDNLPVGEMSLSQLPHFPAGFLPLEVKMEMVIVDCLKVTVKERVTNQEWVKVFTSFTLNEEELSSLRGNIVQENQDKMQIEVLEEINELHAAYANVIKNHALNLTSQELQNLRSKQKELDSLTQFFTKTKQSQHYKNYQQKIDHVKTLGEDWNKLPNSLKKEQAYTEKYLTDDAGTPGFIERLTAQSRVLLKLLQKTIGLHFIWITQFVDQIFHVFWNYFETIFSAWKNYKALQRRRQRFRQDILVQEMTTDLSKIRHSLPQIFLPAGFSSYSLDNLKNTKRTFPLHLVLETRDLLDNCRRDLAFINYNQIWETSQQTIKDVLLSFVPNPLDVLSRFRNPFLLFLHKRQNRIDIEQAYMDFLLLYQHLIYLTTAQASPEFFAEQRKIVWKLEKHEADVLERAGVSFQLDDSAEIRQAIAHTRRAIKRLQCTLVRFAWVENPKNWQRWDLVRELYHMQKSGKVHPLVFLELERWLRGFLTELEKNTKIEIEEKQLRETEKGEWQRRWKLVWQLKNQCWQK